MGIKSFPMDYGIMGLLDKVFPSSPIDSRIMGFFG